MEDITIECAGCRRKGRPSQKPIAEFTKKVGDPTGHSRQCKLCVREKSAEWRSANQEGRLKKSKERYDADPELNRWTTVKCRFKRKRIVLEHYGGGILKCACPGCDVTHIEFLTLDHVDGGGNQHRKQITSRPSSADFYRWVMKNKFPQGFQILCWNCNCAKRDGQGCPHIRILSREQEAIAWFENRPKRMGRRLQELWNAFSSSRGWHSRVEIQDLAGMSQYTKQFLRSLLLTLTRQGRIEVLAGNPRDVKYRFVK